MSKSINNETYLLDEWKQVGTDYTDFCDLLQELEDRTIHIKNSPYTMSVLTPAYYDTARKKNLLYIMQCADILSYSPGAELRLSAASFNEHPIRSRLYDEAQQTSNILLIFTDTTEETPCMRTAFVSQKFISRDLPMFDVGGDFILDGCYTRNLIIARQFAKRKKDVTLCIRKAEDTYKIFGVRSDVYMLLPLTIVRDIADKIINEGIMGKVSCNAWSIDHFRIKIALEFPDKADELKELYKLENEDLIPGIIIETSDTGDCALRVHGYWRVRNAMQIFDTVEQVHKGTDCSVDNVLDKVDKKIFSNYRKLPERLVELLGYTISDPSWNLTRLAGRKAKKEAIMEIYKNVFEEIKLAKAIGKRYESRLLEAIESEIDTSIDYTAYDICINILTLPNRCEGISKLTQEKMATTIALAPYADYSMPARPAPIVLLP